MFIFCSEFLQASTLRLRCLGSTIIRFPVVHWYHPSMSFCEQLAIITTEAIREYDAAREIETQRMTEEWMAKVKKEFMEKCALTMLSQNGIGVTKPT